MAKSKSFLSVASDIWNRLSCHLSCFQEETQVSSFFECLPWYFLTFHWHHACDVNHRRDAPPLHFEPRGILRAHLQLSLSNALQIPLGSKFLTDLSTFKRLHFGMLYHTTFALILILLNLILFSHYLLLNSTSSWKLTFFFIPILLSLSSLYRTDPLELRFGLFVIHYSFHILHPRSVHLLNSF